MWLRRLLGAAAVAVLLAPGCDLANPAGSSGFEPSRLPVGRLEIGVWLPAGMGPQVRLDGARLTGLGITHLEWLQRADVEGVSAEALAMELCSATGLRMPVYYEPPGYSPYDKLRNWATKREVATGFDDSVRARAAALVGRWGGQAGLAGYLVGHEDYSRHVYPALTRTVRILGQADPGRPAYAVGHIDSYPRRGQFLEAFFTEGGAANVFQHEHYVFRAGTPTSGRGLQGRLDELAAGYSRVAQAVQGRHGRWHAIVQAHAETRDGEAYYRKPEPAELRVQAGLALARGAGGILYFLYSSGEERVLDGEGELVQVRQYDGLVDVEGEPTPAYRAAAELNARLAALAPVLEPLHFHGGYRADKVPASAPLRRGNADLDVGFFGDRGAVSHALVVNRLTQGERTVQLEAPNHGLADALTGATLGEGVVLQAGGFRLIRLTPRQEEMPDD